MKNNILTFLIAFMAIHTIPKTNLHATGVTASSRIESMTDEEFRVYEDSLINALYPETELKSIPQGYLIEEPQAKLQAAAIDNSYIPDDHAPHTHLIPGEIPIISGETPFGNKTYTVPIETAPSPTGFQPQVALYYDHNAGNGTLGVGWNVAGVSEITRTGKTKYYDNTTKGITKTSDDAFLLDGMRLIKTATTSTQISYQSEQGFIHAYASLKNGQVTYFEVTYPNGTKGIFGFTDNTEEKFSYPLTSLTDLQGNEIIFGYFYNFNKYRIHTIKYDDITVYFSYLENRPDKRLWFAGGSKVEDPYLLYLVTCRVGADNYSAYEIEYKTQNGLSLIERIKYKGSTVDKFFNPLIFYYGENNQLSGYNTSSVQLSKWYDPETSGGSIRYVKGKFDYGTDNDGFLSYPNKTAYWYHKKNASLNSHSEKQYQNLYPEDMAIPVVTGLTNNDIANLMPSIIADKGFVDILCADIDGKYQEEIIKVNNTVSGTNDQVDFHVYDVRDYRVLKRYTRTFNFNTVLTDNSGKKSVHPKFYFTGDFTGRGKTEVFAVSCHNPLEDTSVKSMCYLFDLESGTKLFEGYVFDYQVTFTGSQQTNAQTAFQNTDRLFVMDYDGDGKNDLCLVNTGGTHIYTFDVSGSSYTLRKVSTFTGIGRNMLAKRELLPGEFNGDGKTDLLLSPQKGLTENKWYVYYSTGNGSFYQSPMFISTYLYDREGHGVFLQDVNGDGLTDLVQYNTGATLTYLATKNGISNEYAYAGFAGNSDIIPTNLNSRNQFSHLITIKDGRVTKYGFRRNDVKEQLLTGVINSYGVIEKNEYRALNENSDFYIPSPEAVYPYTHFFGPLYVINRSEIYYRGKCRTQQKFSFENAILHKEGLGFRGFITTRTTNDRNQECVRKYDPYKYSIPVSEESPVHKIVYTTSVNVAANKTVKITVNSTSETDKLKEVNVSSSYTYDTYGQPTREVKTFGDGSRIETTNTYIHNTGRSFYLLGLLSSQKVKTTYNGSSHTEKVSSSSFTRGLPNDKTIRINNTQTAYYTYSYNSRGQLTNEGLKPYTSPNVWTTSRSYDSNGRLSSSTDRYGLTESYTYDNLGRLGSLTDVRGNTTTYLYDNYNRKRRENYADGTESSFSYQWLASFGGAIRIHQTSTGKPGVHTSIDAFGNVAGTYSTGSDGKSLYEEREYDNYGRLSRASTPYKNYEGRRWTSYFYDDYDRLIRIQEPSGSTTTYSYNGKSMTSTIDQVTSIHTYDDMERPITITDPSGTLTYHLRPDGQPSSTVAPGNVTTSFDYDDAGRQVSTTDPSAGRIVYHYNAAGLRERKVTLKGTQIYFYHPNGLMSGQTNLEGRITYHRNEYQEVIQEEHSNGSSLFYEYDRYGRIIKRTEKGTGSSSKGEDYIYTNGRLESTTHHYNGVKIATENYTYNLYNYLTEITLNGTTSIFKLNKESEMGQPEEVVTGPLNRNYKYNYYGWEEGRSVYNGSQLVQDIAYRFNSSNGNIINRRHGNYFETFTYDNLNRLTEYSGPGSVYYITSYDNKGNVTFKNQINTFLYENSSNPYQITGMKPAYSDGLVPLTNQTISYTSEGRPKEITEEPHSCSFTYNPHHQRNRTVIQKNGSTILTRTYFLNNFEVDEQGNNAKQKLYLGGDYYTAPAVYVKVNQDFWRLYYICRDTQGSITHITDANGKIVEENSYDPWGAMQSPSTHAYFKVGNYPELFLGRGYTGHEHLNEFGLINMNARLYDPLLSRFLSPDPYIQEPGYSQNYNRYSYGFNNPLKYSDPSGEFIFSLFNLGKDFLRNTFVKSWSQGINAWTKSDNWHSTTMAWKIDQGLFKGSPKQIVSRFTWELPQTFLGYSVSHVHNMFDGVKSVTFYGGATAVESYSDNWKKLGLGTTNGFTLGSYINGVRGLRADPYEPLFQHEYGHYLQSQSYGWFYLSKFAIPSALSKGTHSSNPVEQDANVRAFKYFNENIKDYHGWDRGNKINGYNFDLPYSHRDNQKALRINLLSLRGFDYFWGSTNFIITGYFNAQRFNNKY